MKENEKNIDDIIKEYGRVGRDILEIIKKENEKKENKTKENEGEER